MQTKGLAGATKVVCNPGQKPRFKRRLGSLREEIDKLPVLTDGEAFVGHADWEAMRKTKYLLEPAAVESYVTTAAIRGQEVSLAGPPTEFMVAACDLGPNVQ